MKIQEHEYLDLSNFDLYEVEGDDAKSFLQGQLSNDIFNLENSFSLNSRLDVKGKVKSFCYVCDLKDELFLLVDKRFSSILINDLDKFIIMEDVSFKLSSKKVYLVFSPISGAATGFFYGKESSLVFDQDITAELIKLSDKRLEMFSFFSGELECFDCVEREDFLTNSILFNYSYSSSKGCFLGGEPIGKISLNKGADYFPVILQADLSTESEEVKSKIVARDGDYLLARLKRQDRVKGKIVSIEEQSYKLNYLPFFENESFESVCESLYLKAVGMINDSAVEEALELLLKAFKYNPKNEDVCESIGVCFGRIKKFNEGIEWMDKLLELNPDSVLAHTNKSLFLMNLGKIEEAEEEKSQATVKSFAFYAKEAQVKKMDQEKIEQQDRQEKMFLQVLDLDPMDVYARHGLCQIYFDRKNFQKCRDFLKGFDTFDAKAYYLDAQLNLNDGKVDDALISFKECISMAAKQGDLRLANLAQSKLDSL